ncbi:MAG TPA: HD domain-containing phosphohydrolase [Acidimicrobiia bacterium]|nr:HD domain-containing phosphohydrolase [Acidimicrobiia bacterium]
MDIRKKRFALASAYFLLGLVTVVFTLVTWTPKPGTDWVIVGLFALAFAALSFRSVEVNDRMLASSSAMVIATASTYFAIHTSVTPDGVIEFDAVTLAVIIAALGPLDIADFRRRRVFQPVSNFGLLVVSAFAAGFVADLLLDGRAAQQTGDFVYVAAVGALVGLVYNLVNITLVRFGVRIAYGARNILPWSGLWMLFGSQILMGLLGGMLGAVFEFAGNESLLLLILIVYVVGHTVFTSYSVLRVAHESTLRGFVKTLETRDLYTRGHTERVAYFSQLIGEQLGFTGTQLEHMRWAALIHDMGKLAIPIELMQKQGKLTDDEYRRLRTATHKVDDLLSEVDFLRPMVEVCSGAHPRLSNEDFGQEGHTHTTTPTLEQKVLAVADAFDAMTSVRGYRMAMSQRAALDALREDGAPLYDGEVLSALEVALEKVGETYGPPHLATPVADAVSHG